MIPIRGNLVFLFSVTSLAVTTAALAGTIYLASAQTRDSIVGATQAANVAMTSAFVNQVWHELAPMYRHLAATPAAALRGDSRIRRIDAAVRRFSAGTDVLKIKIYDLAGRTVYSSDPAQIATDSSGNAGFLSARAGTPISELTHRGQFGAFDGEVHDRDLVGSYLPVRNSAGAVEAVVELYTDRTGAIVEAGTATVRLGLLLAPLFFAANGLLIAVVWHGNMIRQRQHAQLERQAAALAALAADNQRARQAAEAAAVAKSAFLARMSHEIRTPMNGVLTMAEMLEHGPLDEEQRAIAAIIRESGQALLTIVDDILDFSKIEAGRLQLESVGMSLVQLAEGVCELLSARAAAKRVELVCRVDPGLDDYRRGDPVRLRQILVNLVGNALKFTECGTVTVTVAAGPPPDVVAFAVTDTGIGITAEGQAQLFQPFSQIEANAGRYGGTGLGLSISRGLVQAMGGEIGVTSRTGAGSRFWFTVALPILPERRAVADIDLNGVTVGVVAADPELRATVAAYLGHLGARTATAAQASELPRVGLAVIAGDDRCTAHDFAVESGLPVLCLRSRASAACAECPRYAVASLSRPVHRAQLGRAVADMVGLRGRPAPAPVHRRQEDGADALAHTPPSVDEAEAAGALILVAEDHPTNQRVIMMLLARTGFAAELASDGEAALEMLRRRRYGLLLTDCAMPRLDGFGLTAVIRAEEAARGGARLPIVALTADALPETADRCRRAGMDDYLSKPISRPKLGAVLEHWLPAAGALRRSAACAPPVLDVAALAAIVGGDAAGLKVLLDEFVATTAPLIETAIDAAGRGDAETARRAAHAAAGAARTAGALALGAVCSEFERAAGRGPMPGKDAAERLHEALASVRQAVERVG